MQSTGQAPTQAASLVPIQGSAITYAIFIHSANLQRRRACAPLRYFSTLIVAHSPPGPRQPWDSRFAMRERDEKGTGNREAGREKLSGPRGRPGSWNQRCRAIWDRRGPCFFLLPTSCFLLPAFPRPRKLLRRRDGRKFASSKQIVEEAHQLLVDEPVRRQHFVALEPHRRAREIRHAAARLLNQQDSRRRVPR